MKKAWILFLAAVLALSAAAGAFAEEPDNGTVMCRVENGTYVIRIPVRENDRRWVADELVGDDSVIRLVSAEYEDGQAKFFLDADGKLIWQDEKENAGDGMRFEETVITETVFDSEENG